MEATTEAITEATTEGDHIIKISKLFMILLKITEIWKCHNMIFGGIRSVIHAKSCWITLCTFPYHVATVPRKRCVIFMLCRCDNSKSSKLQSLIKRSS